MTLTKPQGIAVAGAILVTAAVVGFLLGRSSVRPDGHAATVLAAAHAELTDSTRVFHAKRDSLLALIAGAEAAADSAKRQAARAGQRAAVAETQRVATVTATDSALGRAEAAGAALADVRVALAAERAAQDSARVAWADQLEAQQRESAALRVEGAHLAELAAASLNRVTAANAVIAQLTRQVRGCRLIWRIGCPVIGPGYGLVLSDGQVRHGVTLSVSLPIH